MQRDIRRVFGDRIRELRAERDWSQEEMADATGLHWTYIGQTERGERNLTLRSIQKFAKGLKIEMAELFKGLG
jgi:XRE family transcriptional regulator, regulator of sulfur utilization